MRGLSAADPLPSGRWRLPRLPRPLWFALALGLALGAGLELHAALESPGVRIRGELKAAAGDLASAPAMRSTIVLARVRDEFGDRDVSIDAGSWPVVSVTIHGVDAATCRDAMAKADRIEGLVVVALDHRGAAEECRGTNDMTWRIMP
jgi:hypothetical protein